jgi:hypothetical protein
MRYHVAALVRDVLAEVAAEARTAAGGNLAAGDADAAGSAAPAVDDADDGATVASIAADDDGAATAAAGAQDEPASEASSVTTAATGTGSGTTGAAATDSAPTAGDAAAESVAANIARGTKVSMIWNSGFAALFSQRPSPAAPTVQTTSPKKKGVPFYSASAAALVQTVRRAPRGLVGDAAAGDAAAAVAANALMGSKTALVVSKIVDLTAASRGLVSVLCHAELDGISKSPIASVSVITAIATDFPSANRALTIALDSTSSGAAGEAVKRYKAAYVVGFNSSILAIFVHDNNNNSIINK